MPGLFFVPSPSLQVSPLRLIEETVNRRRGLRTLFSIPGLTAAVAALVQVFSSDWPHVASIVCSFAFSGGSDASFVALFLL